MIIWIYIMLCDIENIVVYIIQVVIINIVMGQVAYVVVPTVVDY